MRIVQQADAALGATPDGAPQWQQAPHQVVQPHHHAALDVRRVELERALQYRTGANYSGPWGGVGDSISAPNKYAGWRKHGWSYGGGVTSGGDSPSGSFDGKNIRAVCIDAGAEFLQSLD